MTFASKSSKRSDYHQVSEAVPSIMVQTLPEGSQTADFLKECLELCLIGIFKTLPKVHDGVIYGHRCVVVITTAQLRSTKPELMFCASSNPACDVSEVCNVEKLRQWSRMEIKLNLFHWPAISQK